MKTINFKLGSAHVKFSSNFPQLFDFVEMYFDKIRISNASEASPDIDVAFHWDEGSVGTRFEKFKENDNFSQIGGNTLASSNEVVTIKKIERRWKALFVLELCGERIKLNVFLQRKPVKDYFRHGPLAKPKDDWYFTFIYHTIYYPVFWYLEQFKSRYPLHASALNVNKKGVVICGLEGIGKTSLNLMLLKEANSTFLSDNIIFYDSKNVYPCYELIRLHKGEDDELWKKKFDKVNQSEAMKDFYAPVEEATETGTTPNIVIFPEFTSSFKSCKLSNSEAAGRAILLSYMPDELRNYADYRHLYQLLRGGSNPWLELNEKLIKNFSQAECYSIGMVKAAGLQHNVDKLKNEIFQMCEA